MKYPMKYKTDQPLFEFMVMVHGSMDYYLYEEFDSAVNKAKSLGAINPVVLIYEPVFETYSREWYVKNTFRVLEGKLMYDKTAVNGLHVEFYINAGNWLNYDEKMYKRIVGDKTKGIIGSCENVVDFNCNNHQYFTNAVHQLLGGKRVVGLCKENNEEKVFYSFVEIAPKLFIDSVGVFSNPMKSRFETQSNYIKCVIKLEVEGEDCDIISKYKKSGLGYTNVELKREMREYVRNHIPVVVCNIGGIERYIGLIGRDEYNHILYYQFDNQTKKFGKMVHVIPEIELSRSFVGGLGWKEAKRWYYKN